MNETLKLIQDEYNAAIKKHPFFANNVFPARDTYSWSASKVLEHRREALRLEKQTKNLSATSVLECEFLEAVEAYEVGNKDHAIQELAQCAAVIMRMIDMIKEE